MFWKGLISRCGGRLDRFSSCKIPRQNKSIGGRSIYSAFYVSFIHLISAPVNRSFFFSLLGPIRKRVSSSCNFGASEASFINISLTMRRKSISLFCQGSSRFPFFSIRYILCAVSVIIFQKSHTDDGRNVLAEVVQTST